MSKGGSQPSSWQIAQSRDCFCDFGRKSENLSLPVDTQCFAAMDGSKSLNAPRTSSCHNWREFKTYTSLRHNLTQAELDFLIFVQWNKIDSALCNLPIKNLRATFWHPNQLNIIILHFLIFNYQNSLILCYSQLSSSP